VRGRGPCEYLLFLDFLPAGLFARSLMKAQAASPSFTPVYAALVSVINTHFPAIGELILVRLILTFRKSFRRNDKVSHILLAFHNGLFPVVHVS